MSAIEQCRSAALGGHVLRCEGCGSDQIAYNSCRNRHCPKCQSAAARRWLEARQNDLLPVEYYHVVFTLPGAIAEIAYQNKALIYGLLFDVAAETLLSIAADPKHLGASIGATLAFLSARFLFRDVVQRKFGDKLRAVNAGVEREGAFYLFTLRLVPLFPFFVVNLAMALTPIRVRTFYWVSQLGMLLGTLAYVNAGAQLAHIESLRGILSPTVLISFAVLGVLPLAAKKIVELMRARRGFAK